ncbi:PREDICTED: uncharacterized protein LOC109215606 [Nicotiana attenuata]|uniref:uncharacterized protein LOC109215606 n=1 Tax=Nicotiana attenuata TaxID=49451 RepID=UPI000904BDD2|nr:PREDICTED: uncharacterized protein LOC109215606 [Nicotiana attenuata]
MCQRKYVLELIAEAGLGGAKPAVTPLELNQKLSSQEYVKYTQSSSKDESLKDAGPLSEISGEAVISHHDQTCLAFTVLSQYMHSPKTSHMEVALRVVKYIKEAPGLGLFMPAQNFDQLLAYCDSD